MKKGIFCLAVIAVALSILAIPCSAKSIEVNKALFASNIETFGIYEETSNRYKSGSTALIYLEVADFMLVEANGTYSLDLSSDLSVIGSYSPKTGPGTKVIG
ncbi:MAG TPA: hypothetical protein ENN89_03120 [Synergistetes bacterium]|nr:hypothetical protein [Synergistota bacterium]